MTNREKLNNVLCKTFRVEESQLRDLQFGSNNWDSIGHITMVTELEAAFSISISSEDIMKMSTYNEIVKLLEESYGVNFE